MSSPQLRSGFGRVLIFGYGILALAATARSAFQLLTKLAEAPAAYLLSGVAALIYVVATWALATDRRLTAVVAVTVELLGVITVGAMSHWFPQYFAEPTVWSEFGAGYGWVPLVLPLLGIWWLWRNRVVTTAT